MYTQDDQCLCDVYLKSKIITFDFDGTLNNSRYNGDVFIEDLTPKLETVELLKQLSEEGYTIYCVTSRMEETKNDVVAFVNGHVLPIDMVVFTNGRLKAEILLKLGSILHFDDSQEEVENNLKYNIKTIQIK
jgi:FMN phosphatase YigB (HAD superfamily)